MPEESDPPPQPERASDALAELLLFGDPETRRQFLKTVAGTGAAFTLGPHLLALASAPTAGAATPPRAMQMVDVQLKINSRAFSLKLDPRTSLLDVYFVGEPDYAFNPIGARGMGEIGITGIAAAVANAVYHATGKRVRDLPITPDKLL
jgi:hypothetical protein